MNFNLNNFLNTRNKDSKIGDFQDLDHIDGLSISTTSANLYNSKRDDLVMFYFKNGANHASVYTQSKIISENIKWNLNIKSKKIKALVVNARNANALTGKEGYKGLKLLADELSKKLTEKQKLDESEPEKIKPTDILFACTGTIGETFPTQKINASIPELIKKIKYTQNKYIWMKAAMGILTTDLKPKLSMEECYIGKKQVKIYGLAKGSGMVFPNMATTLGFIFTDAKISTNILKQLLKKNISRTFNAISCDGDTSTNDMLSIFATGEANNSEINNINDNKLNNFNGSLFNVLLNLAKRVVYDGEGSSKFITINVRNCKTEEDARKICFSIANSPLVKTAIAGEDPNWGRVVMAIGKSKVNLNLNKLSLKFGPFKIIENGQLSKLYKEEEVT
ncbi:bifunctional glutamate N-acetyltransferase/amino-acid acetyltransferase ArgJ, partial [Candidatus Pelagibacter sp.]|nr:bifunctional glutamate N-acetyltransferase/amino-acid acetyltransferase ArgJ [Candidatus Pelagibacter sp.]